MLSAERTKTAKCISINRYIKDKRAACPVNEPVKREYLYKLKGMGVFMKILLITDEVWNDKIYVNNVLSNWFDDSTAQLANVYLSPGVPENKCCSNYFQVTDKMMLKSLFTKKKAGVSFHQEEEILIPQPPEELLPPRLPEEGPAPQLPGEGEAPAPQLPEEGELPAPQFPGEGELPAPRLPGKLPAPQFPVEFPEEAGQLYDFLKSIASETIRFLRDFIWTNGKFDKDKLSKFIHDFNPDIIFSSRLASRKMLRFEKEIAKTSNKPLVAFTSGDEYTLKQFRISPVYWIRRSKFRKDFKKNIPIYQKYYTISDKQAEAYKNLFQINTDVIRKCGDFKDDFNIKEAHYPVKLVYAGSLRNDRWKTLAEIKKVLEKINKNRIRMTMDIYAMDEVTNNQRRQLEDGVQSFIKPPVSPEELKKIYKSADIALYVEAFDLKNKMQTKYSFSSKIIDCLASTCCVMAVCPKENTGYEYLKKQDAAICVDNPGRIYPVLKKLFLHNEKLYEYQKKAWDCGISNHEKSVVQQKIIEDFADIIVRSSKEWSLKE